jgi:hypothetical protein
MADAKEEMLVAYGSARGVDGEACADDMASMSEI